jgi:CDP-glucose 4,6-dehydratase
MGRLEVKRFQNIFNGVYAGKRVLVIGDTGFKGSWLSFWLKELGARVSGYSAYFPSEPCLFNTLNLKGSIDYHVGDVRDLQKLEKIFKKARPQIVFHLAAQSIVRTAYQDPKRTFDTNLGGTVNVLECIRKASGIEAAVIITSDKCYENFGIKRGYHENDRLGGEDPYSASKACAEIAFKAYFKSFFSQPGALPLATARAGNVIGGGDWAAYRIVPDCVRAWSLGEAAIIRNPKATRPWQHVLEPLSGYLWLGACLLKQGKKLTGESFNFGPRPRTERNVGELVELFLSIWGKGQWKYVRIKEKKEAMLLKLSPAKARKILSWQANLSFKETICFTAEWYKAYYQKTNDMGHVTRSQIKEYIKKAQAQKLDWAKG